jgi:hypothetical protein
MIGLFRKRKGVVCITGVVFADEHVPRGNSSERRFQAESKLQPGSTEIVKTVILSPLRLPFRHVGASR